MIRPLTQRFLFTVAFHSSAGVSLRIEGGARNRTTIQVPPDGRGKLPWLEQERLGARGPEIPFTRVMSTGFQDVLLTLGRNGHVPGLQIAMMWRARAACKTEMISLLTHLI